MGVPGKIRGDTPFMVVKDPEIISEVFIKEFSKFQGRGRMMHIYEMDPVFSRYIVLSKGETWRTSRASMSPFFTTAKLKAVYDTSKGRGLWQNANEMDLTLITDKVFPTRISNSVMPSLLQAQKQFIDVLGEHADKGVEADINSLCERLTFDVIGKAAYAPLPRETLNELSTNCMTIFVGGYDTTRLVLTYWFYVMGRHPDIQEKMRHEVLQAFEKEGEHLSVYTLKELPYTNQVISETMRMYPPILTTPSLLSHDDPVCTSLQKHPKPLHNATNDQQHKTSVAQAFESKDKEDVNNDSRHLA
nr:cytochrome P450 6B1-like [Dermacentor andersoni]